MAATEKKATRKRAGRAAGAKAKSKGQAGRAKARFQLAPATATAVAEGPAPLAAAEAPAKVAAEVPTGPAVHANGSPADRSILEELIRVNSFRARVISRLVKKLTS